MTTTWKEFKDKVDAELLLKGASQDITILYIDINGSDDFEASTKDDILSIS